MWLIQATTGLSALFCEMFTTILSSCLELNHQESSIELALRNNKDQFMAIFYFQLI